MLANPATAEYEVVRTSLLPGLLKTIASNRKSPLPLKLFEVSDIVVQDPTADRRAKNERRVCVVYANKTSGFELVHGILDRLMLMLMVDPRSVQPQSSVSNGSLTYTIQESTRPTYFPGRQADVVLRKGGKEYVVGVMGIVHPEVLKAFDVEFPVSCLEMTIEPFI